MSTELYRYAALILWSLRIYVVSTAHRYESAPGCPVQNGIPFWSISVIRFSGMKKIIHAILYKPDNQFMFARTNRNPTYIHGPVICFYLRPHINSVAQKEHACVKLGKIISACGYGADLLYQLSHPPQHFRFLIYFFVCLHVFFFSLSRLSFRYLFVYVLLMQCLNELLYYLSAQLRRWGTTFLVDKLCACASHFCRTHDVLKFRLLIFLSQSLHIVGILTTNSIYWYGL